MNRSWTRLRRSLLTLAFTGALGFGAGQALATPTPARVTGCSLDGVQVRDCSAACRARGYDEGTCAMGYCICRVWV